MQISVVIPVYRDGTRAVAAADAILRQSLPPETSLEIVIVDDGSEDDTSTLIAGLDDPRVRALSLPRNRGRSSTRNIGANAAKGEFIVFMDCDCLPHDEGFILGHVATLNGGAVASIGHVSGHDEGFWSRYQHAASQRRERQHEAGAMFSGSSQNLAVRKQAFEAAGGFDTAYRHYGFEDRDLLIRLSRLGRIAWAPGPGVMHRDSLNMRDVARKMREAGALTSAKFSAEHPGAYSELGYARIDTRLHPCLRCLRPVNALLLTALPRLTDRSIAAGMPFALNAAMVKLCAALAFAAGTAESSSS